MAKSGNWMWIIVIVLVLVVLGGGFQGGINLGAFDPTQWFGGGNGTGLVDVDKQLKFAMTDKYAGSAETGNLYVYDGETLAQLEGALALSSGTVNTAFTYPSGKHIYVKWDDTANGMKFFDITVPKMNSKDAEAATYNNIPLTGFAIGTYTTDDLRFAGTAISDGGNYNKTTSGNTPTFTYRLANTGNDNTGIETSYDPIYASQWKVNVFVQLSGTNYETVLVYGFTYDYTLGTTHYVAKEADARALTKWKIGNDYVAGYEGVWTMQFSLDLTGYSGDAATMQIYVYAYSDPTWSQNHGGNYGVNKVELAEHTVLLYT